MEQRMEESPLKMRRKKRGAKTVRFQWKERYRSRSTICEGDAAILKYIINKYLIIIDIASRQKWT